MKKLIYITLLLGSLSILSACEQFLNIEPETELSSALAFDNVTGIRAGINGVYSTIHNDWVERQVIFAECFASTVKEINPVNNSNYQNVLSHQAYTDVFNAGNYLWRLSYQGIHLTNEMLRALPEIPEPDQTVIETKNRLQGEVLFLRGMMYFVLNRFWAQPQNGLSVPLLTEPITVNDKPSRNTIDEVINQILLDLEQAEMLMEGVNQNQGRITQMGVKAFMARVYFEYKDYEKARQKADEVISSGKYSLINDDIKISHGTEITSENIFSFLGASNDLAALNMFQIFSPANSNIAKLAMSDDMLDLIDDEAGDQRFRKLFIKLGGKHLVSRKYDDRTMNLPYIRLPEMYLIRAETRAMAGNLDGALEDINLIRKRASLNDLTYSSKEDLLNKITRERTVELAAEGNYLFNQKRLQKSVGGLPYEEAAYKLVFFIPEPETNQNENLIQNDFW